MNFLEFFSESIQDVKYTDWNPREYKNRSKRDPPAQRTLNYSVKWGCHTVVIGQWDPRYILLNNNPAVIRIVRHGALIQLPAIPL